MLATVLNGVREVALEQVADPVIHHPTDAVVTVTAASICGSDLHQYRGDIAASFPKRIGHEFVGIVEEVGSQVSTVKRGDFVVAAFSVSDGTCDNCRNGLHSSCTRSTFWGQPDDSGVIADGGQGQHVRVPFADGTLVRTEGHPARSTIPHLLALTDPMVTGHHAARTAGVHPGSVVVVIGDGPVGLCAVIAARRLGAQRIVVMSRHPDRQRLARDFGATDIVADRGDDGVAQVGDLLVGAGSDAVLECVGTEEAFLQAVGSARPGARLGCVGIPRFQLDEKVLFKLFRDNIGVNFGVAQSRAYLPELLPDVLAGNIAPGRIFDASLPLADVANGYRLMDERSAIKVLLTP